MKKTFTNIQNHFVELCRQLLSGQPAGEAAPVIQESGSSLKSRLAKHFVACSAAAVVAAGTVGDASAAIVSWNNANLVIPATIDGLYINVETQVTGSAGSVVAGWDINPYSATSLTWFNATGTGMMRYPGVTTGSAGNLALGTTVGATGSYGSGAVIVGSAAGNWQLNASNYFGFRFTASDGLTHYGWGRFVIGAAISGGDRTIAELHYENVAATPIIVGSTSTSPFCQAPTLSAAIVNACGNTGQIDLTVSGGIPSPFSILWSNGESTEDITGLAAGSYTVTVTTNGGGCSVSGSYTVNSGAGSQEICNNIDDDCDGQIDEGLPLNQYFPDADGDTYGAATGIIFSCVTPAPAGFVNRNNDCNDNNSAVNPLATEVCNNIDDDCDGQIDEFVKLTFFIDNDGDGFGSSTSTTQACTAPVGYAANDNDCNDNAASAYPGATEICNGIDDDCDGFADNGVTFFFYYADADGDTYGNPNMDSLACSQPSGYVLNNSDCDDSNSSINPAATEVCDSGVDNDCDGLADDLDPSVTGQGTYYTDGDGDTYGAGSPILACVQPSGTSTNNTDCNDGNATVNPGAVEICDGLDQNCNGTADEGLFYSHYFTDLDGDGYGTGDTSLVLDAVSDIGLEGSVHIFNDGNMEESAAQTFTASQSGTFGHFEVKVSGLSDGSFDGVFTLRLGGVPGVGPVLYSTPVTFNSIGWVQIPIPAGIAVSGGSVYHFTVTAAGVTSDNMALWRSNGSTPGGHGGGSLFYGSLPFFPGSSGLVYGDSQIDDLDFKQYVSTGSALVSCSSPGVGYSSVGGDCDDNNSSINPAATEICDSGVDNDCDGLADDLDPSVSGQGSYYADLDGDTYGSGSAIMTCNQPAGSSLLNTDCDDSNSSIYPGATETCNGLDDDCDGSVDEGTASPLGSISGPASSCTAVANGSATFSVAAVSGITSYLWTVPSGMTLVSGQNTNSIQVSWTASAINNGLSGSMTVTGSNACGSTAPVQVSIDLNYTTPVRPPSPSGPTRLCPGETATFSITPVNRATSYIWTVPTGMTITSGSGTNIIQVSVGATFAGGTIEIIAVNACGQSPSRTKAISLNLPAAPGAIAGQATGLCGAVNVTYTTSGVSSAASYVWTVPAGATLVSGQGTTSITVSYSSTLTTGIITVQGVNSCGVGTPRSLTVQGAPAIASPITGAMTVCPSATNVQYDIQTVAGATNYNWTPPNGASIATGQGSKTAKVNYGPNSGTNYNISVVTSNACGSSNIKVLGGIAVNSIYCAPRMSGDIGAFTTLEAYPNPARDQVTVSFQSLESSQCRIQVIDLGGRVVILQSMECLDGFNTVRISTEGLSAGLYSITLESNGGRIQRMLMIE